MSWNELIRSKSAFHSKIWDASVLKLLQWQSWVLRRIRIIACGRGNRLFWERSSRFSRQIRSWRTIALSSSCTSTENSRILAVIRSCITSTCFSENSRDYVFLNVMYSASGSMYFRVALALASPCRFCYSYLLFHALLTFYAACPSPAEPPLKYHVENNSLSNSHFSLRGWFRRNMHETEASEVKMEKKRWCDEKFGDS